MNSTPCYAPKGRLTFDTVLEIRQAGENAMMNLPVCFDFNEVTQVDSAAISLLLDWNRTARQKGVKLTFTHIPDHLLDLAGLYGLRDLIIPSQA
ncbi:MAG TPA: STAS domain-containing protein [Burkholderiales bacterium]|nr:STAS domain-containing protein [Burkholderiales bacterium]